MLSLALALVLVYGLLVSGQSSGECPLRVLSQSDFSTYRKLNWLKPSATVNATSLPDGAVAELRCDTGFLHNQLIAKSYPVQCTNGKFNRTLRYDDFLCRSRQQANTTTYRRPCCDQFFGILHCVGKNLIAYEVGHLQPSGCAKLLYTVCVDKSDLRTKFAYQPRPDPPPPKAPKVGCKKGIWGFNEFGGSVEEKKILSKAYYQKYQKQRITTFYPGRYNRKNPYPYYFNRGHIVPSGDMSECEQSATYEYINLAPQWQVLNQGSWNTIEMETRDMVRNTTDEWVIYTGTYGKIPTPRGLIYLIPMFNEKGASRRGYVPVPMLYWKIVYNKCDRSKSLVYVGVNNPEFKSFEEITRIYLLCNPIRNRHNKLYIGSEFKGFVYQCDLEEFLEKLMSDEGIVRGSDGTTEASVTTEQLIGDEP